MFKDFLWDNLFGCMNQVLKLRRKDSESARGSIISKRANILSNVEKIGEIFIDQLKEALPIVYDPWFLKNFLKVLYLLPYLTIIW